MAIVALRVDARSTFNVGLPSGTSTSDVLVEVAGRMARPKRFSSLQIAEVTSLMHLGGVGASILKALAHKALLVVAPAKGSSNRIVNMRHGQKCSQKI